MTRRFIYDPAADRVLEVGEVRGSRLASSVQYDVSRSEYRATINTAPSPVAGAKFLQATLERAERREIAQRRFGNENRWAE